MFISEHLRTHLHCDSPQESALWTFNHQAQNHNCCIPVARSPQTLSTWLSTALPGCILLLNCNNPNLLSNDSFVLSKNCIKPGFSNSHLLKIPCTQATGKPESTLATQTFVPSFLTHGEDYILPSSTTSHPMKKNSLFIKNLSFQLTADVYPGKVLACTILSSYYSLL